MPRKFSCLFKDATMTVNYKGCLTPIINDIDTLYFLYIYNVPKYGLKKGHSLHEFLFAIDFFYIKVNGFIRPELHNGKDMQILPQTDVFIYWINFQAHFMKTHVQDKCRIKCKCVCLCMCVHVCVCACVEVDCI